MAESDKLMLGRADKAKVLLNDPEFQEAFKAVESSIFEKIKQCPIRDTEGLQILRLQLKLLADVKANIESVVNTGKVIQDRINWLERTKKAVYGR